MHLYIHLTPTDHCMCIMKTTAMIIVAISILLFSSSLDASPHFDFTNITSDNKNAIPNQQPFSQFVRLRLPQGATSPESVTLDPRGNGPYVVSSDGRILIWQNNQFVDFATTSPTRDKQLCDGTSNPDLGPVCGRPLALSFDRRSRNLYIADAYRGLMVVGPNGGVATPLVSSAEGVPFRFLNGVDVDPTSGQVYFSDASTTFDLRNLTQPGFVRDVSGRLMRYDPATRQVRVLLRGLATPTGPAVNFDGAFVIVPEIFASRIQRFWIRGPRANTADIFLTVQGNPNKIKRDPGGAFWITLNYMYGQPQVTVPQALNVNSQGGVMRVQNFQGQYPNTRVFVVQEERRMLFVGSRDVDFVTVYR